MTTGGATVEGRAASLFLEVCGKKRQLTWLRVAESRMRGGGGFVKLCSGPDPAAAALESTFLSSVIHPRHRSPQK